MADFRSSSGQEFALPDDLSPEEEQVLIDRLIQQSPQQPDVIGPFNPPMMPSAKEKAEIQLGRPLAKDESGGLAEFSAPGIRFDLMSSTSRDPKIATDEKLLKLKNKFPEFQFEVLNDPVGGENIVIIPPGQDPVILDSSDIFTLSDLAEAGGMILNPNTFTSILAAIRTRGGSLAQRMLGQTIGGAAGEAISSGTEQLRGFQLDPISNIAGDIAVMGAIGGVAEPIIGAPRKLINAITGRGLLKLTPDEEEVIKLFKEHEIRGPTVGMMHPLASTMELQAARTSKAVQNFQRDLMHDVLLDFKKAKVQLANASISDEELGQVLNKMKDDIVALSTFRAVSPEASGVAIQRGREEFVKAGRLHLNRKYNKALAAGKDAF